MLNSVADFLVNGQVLLVKYSTQVNQACTFKCNANVTEQQHVEAVSSNNYDYQSGNILCTHPQNDHVGRATLQAPHAGECLCIFKVIVCSLLIAVEVCYDVRKYTIRLFRF